MPPIEINISVTTNELTERSTISTYCRAIFSVYSVHFTVFRAPGAPYCSKIGKDLVILTVISSTLVNHGSTTDFLEFERNECTDHNTRNVDHV